MGEEVVEAKKELELVLCPHCWNYLPRKQFKIDPEDRKYRWYSGKYSGWWYAKCERCRDGA